MAAAGNLHRDETILPSVNLLDGKAKQFDDGLYAALDLAYYHGLRDSLCSHVELVRRIYEKTSKESKAAAFLAAGLELAEVHVEARDHKAKEDYLRSFRNDEIASKPVGFYTWNDDLKACFRFLHFSRKNSNRTTFPTKWPYHKRLAKSSPLTQLCWPTITKPSLSTRI